ncbi:DUF1614 domain-containing protein [Methanonatronarchaeum sp. AMET-Sl]|uniref:DUF1614 domain-containing protein n=1 Tax=Methanonatronarchaeum sp. AMET-Sl TaxID=3037654 RepID=UPI00244E087D|nr:DUF1614 domain-containing protein [Methanonatronarchaeum sp. AMET-Sl]WGI17628.1 DUF1614 domain-containing protein [Methanonatronarchaeum sp. AMET-Sl]
MRGRLFLPLALPLLIIFFIIPFLLAYIVLTVGAVLGFTPLTTLLIYMAILVGSIVNIPITEIEKKQIMDQRPSFFETPFQQYNEKKYTTIAINLGGALIPTLISIYLIFGLTPIEILATLSSLLIVIFVSKAFSRIVKGVGIAMPMLIPPITAVTASLLATIIFSTGQANLAKISFASGVLGVLIGADLLNLHKIKKVGADTISIGGAGTFDGIFLTGVFSVIFSIFFI